MLVVFLLNKKETLPSLINVGTGIGIEHPRTCRKNTSHSRPPEGAIVWDEKMPDGTPQKVMDTSIHGIIRVVCQYDLEDVGLKKAYEWFIVQ
jgi:hypothetical protein